MEGGRELSPSQQAESHLPGTTLLQVALLRAAPSSLEEQGRLGIVLPSQHPSRRSWPGAPVKGIGMWPFCLVRRGTIKLKSLIRLFSFLMFS